jgi:hypothetical protein
MNTYCLKSSRNESVLESFYHDAYIHTEDKKVFNVHKVILAMYSPFLHDYFQSRPGHDVNDIFFQSTHSTIVKAELDLLYTGKVSIQRKYLRSFTWFVETLLGINVEEMTETSSYEPQEPAVSEEIKEGNKEESLVSHGELPLLPSADPSDNAHGDECNEAASSLASAWTLTSINSEDLRQMCHSVVTLINNRRQYKCDICSHVSKTFGDASQHFIDKHQNCQRERKQIDVAMNSRKSCLDNIFKVNEEIRKGCNEAMATNQLGLIADELNKHLDVLGGFEKKKHLAPIISRKARELCHALNDAIKDIDLIIKQVDKNKT